VSADGGGSSRDERARTAVLAQVELENLADDVRPEGGDLDTPTDSLLVVKDLPDSLKEPLNDERMVGGKGLEHGVHERGLGEESEFGREMRGEEEGKEEVER
jgi:hypothetical protein